MTNKNQKAKVQCYDIHNESSFQSRPSLTRVLKTGGQTNLTKRPHHRRTWTVQWYSTGCAPVCTAPNTCFLGPTRVHNPNGISISSAIFAQLTAECRRTFPVYSPKNWPFGWGDPDPPSNTWILRPTRASTQTASWSVKSFCRAL